MLLFALFNEVTTYFTGDSIILVFKTLLKYSSACFVTQSVFNLVLFPSPLERLSKEQL